MTQQSRISFFRYFAVFAVALSLISLTLVYLNFGPTPTLVLGEFIAVVAAIGLIVDSRIRHNRSKQGGKSEWWTGLVVQGKKIRVRVDWNSCMGSSSCVELAPKVFRLDWEKKKSVFDPAPLQLLDEHAKATDPDLVFFAAQSCPYRAIILEDDETRQRIFP